MYLGIDQHARQITISLRAGNGDVLQARQVSTQPEKINAFFQQLTRERLHNGESFVAVLEVYGFNDWLIPMLHPRISAGQPHPNIAANTARRLMGCVQVFRDSLRGRGFHGGRRCVHDYVTSTGIRTR
jgi:hypothetical protein